MSPSVSTTRHAVPRPSAGVLALLACAAVASGCAVPALADGTADGVPDATPAVSHDAGRQEGAATWYGQRFAGRRTASGERFDPAVPTMAHRTLPFGTWVRVTHLGNGRSVVVRVNDRGPFTRGRIADLSQAAARELGMLGAGTARVRLDVLGPSP